MSSVQLWQPGQTAQSTSWFDVRTSALPAPVQQPVTLRIGPLAVPVEASRCHHLYQPQVTLVG
jgi:hypothetical protein